MPRPPSTKTILKRNLNKEELEPKAPIVKEMFLPNYSVVKGSRNLGVEGSVVFLNNGGGFETDSTNLFWDDSNNRLGIGTDSPSQRLDVDGSINLPSGNILFTTNLTGLLMTAGTNNLSITLGDMAGDSKLIIRNIAGVSKAEITSEGDLTATSYGGITEANLVDKTANETISGDWNFTDEIHAADGTDSLPSYTFESDTDTGMYRVSTNSLGFTALGSKVLEVSNAKIKAEKPIITADVILFGIEDTTPTVRFGNIFKTRNIRGTTITNFVQGLESQQITIISDDNATTIEDNANIYLNGSANFAMSIGDTLTLVLGDDSVWHEIGRLVR